MAIAKEEQHKQEVEIHQRRHEDGVQQARAWLHRERDEINDKWPRLQGEELLNLQGEAKMVARLIRIIDKGPGIKPVVGA